MIARNDDQQLVNGDLVILAVCILIVLYVLSDQFRHDWMGPEPESVPVDCTTG